MWLRGDKYIDCSHSADGASRHGFLSSIFLWLLEELHVKWLLTTCVWAVLVFDRCLCNRVLSEHILTCGVSVGFEVLAGNHIISCQSQQWKWTRATRWRSDFMNGWQRSHRMAEPLCFGSSSLLWLPVEASQSSWLNSQRVVCDRKQDSHKLTTTAWLQTSSCWEKNHWVCVRGEFSVISTHKFTLFFFV